MSSDLFGLVPNLFLFLVDDECLEVREKFAENDMSCQFASNCGNLLTLLIIILLFKGILSIFSLGFREKNKALTGLGLKMNNFNDKINIEFFITVFNMF